MWDKKRCFIKFLHLYPFCVQLCNFSPLCATMHGSRYAIILRRPCSRMWLFLASECDFSCKQCQPFLSPSAFPDKVASDSNAWLKAQSYKYLLDPLKPLHPSRFQFWKCLLVESLPLIKNVWVDGSMISFVVIVACGTPGSSSTSFGQRGL